MDKKIKFLLFGLSLILFVFLGLLVTALSVTHSTDSGSFVSEFGNSEFKDGVYKFKNKFDKLQGQLLYDKVHENNLQCVYACSAESVGDKIRLYPVKKDEFCQMLGYDYHSGFDGGYYIKFNSSDYYSFDYRKPTEYEIGGTSGTYGDSNQLFHWIQCSYNDYYTLFDSLVSPSSITSTEIYNHFTLNDNLILDGVNVQKILMIGPNEQEFASDNTLKTTDVIAGTQFKVKYVFTSSDDSQTYQLIDNVSLTMDYIKDKKKVGLSVTEDISGGFASELGNNTKQLFSSSLGIGIFVFLILLLVLLAIAGTMSSKKN